MSCVIDNHVIEWTGRGGASHTSLTDRLFVEQQAQANGIGNIKVRNNYRCPVESSPNSSINAESVFTSRCLRDSCYFESTQFRLCNWYLISNSNVTLKRNTTRAEIIRIEGSFSPQQHRIVCILYVWWNFLRQICSMIQQKYWLDKDKLPPRSFIMCDNIPVSSTDIYIYILWTIWQNIYIACIDYSKPLYAHAYIHYACCSCE